MFTGQIEIFARTLNGKRIRIKAHPEDTIDNVKKEIQRIEGIPVNKQIIKYGGKILKDDYTLSYCNIHNHSEVKLMQKYEGKKSHSCVIVYAHTK